MECLVIPCGPEQHCAAQPQLEKARCPLDPEAMKLGGESAEPGLRGEISPREAGEIGDEEMESGIETESACSMAHEFAPLLPLFAFARRDWIQTAPRSAH